MEATEVLRILRADGWSDAAVGYALGTSRRNIWRWRTGRTVPMPAVTQVLNGLNSLNRLALEEDRNDDSEDRCFGEFRGAETRGGGLETDQRPELLLISG